MDESYNLPKHSSNTLPWPFENPTKFSVFLVLYVLLHHWWYWGTREAVTKITPIWPVLPFCIILTCQAVPLRAMGIWRGPTRIILKTCISFVISLWRPGAQRWPDHFPGPQELSSSQAAQSATGNVLYIYQVLHISHRHDFEHQNTRGHEVEKRKMVEKYGQSRCDFSMNLSSSFTFVFWAYCNKFVIFTLS